MLNIAGPGAQAVKQIVETSRVDDTPVLELASLVKLRVVRTYRSVGSMIGNTIFCEVAARVASQHKVATALRAKVFRSSVFPRRVKLNTSHATGRSRLLFHAGTWPALSASQQKASETAVAFPLRMIANYEDMNKENWVSNEVVTSQMRSPPASALAVAARLRLFARLTTSAPQVKACIQTPGGMSWRREIVRGLIALQKVLSKRCSEPPHPLEGVQAWETFAARYRMELKSAIRKFLDVTAEDPVL